LAALQVLSGVLSGGGIGRLDKRLVDTKKAVGVGMGSAQLHDPGLTTFSASLSDEQPIDEVKKIALETISQSVIIPSGLSLSKITMLPIFALVISFEIVTRSSFGPA
jgi:hypothetical protein